MLTDLKTNSSYLRYSQRRVEFKEGMALTESQYKVSAREKEAGISVTPLIRGEVQLGNLLKADNEGAVLQECIARGLVKKGNPDKIKYTGIKNLIKGRVRADCIAANPGKEVSDAIGKAFKPISDATVTVNYNK